MDRKSLKQPDEFVSFWSTLGRQLVAHRRKLLAALVAVVLVIAGTWASLAWRESRAERATQDFARIERIAAAEILSDRDKEGDKAGDKEKEVVAKAEQAALKFKSEQERLEAAVRQADAFLSAHGSAGLGRRVLLGKAGRLMSLGKHQDATAIYQQLLAGETDPGLRLIQQEGLAASMEASGQVEQALALYNQSAEEAQKAGGFYADRMLFAKARLLEKQGKTQEAEKTLRAILERVPATVLRREIDDRLAVLGGK